MTYVHLHIKRLLSLLNQPSNLFTWSTHVKMIVCYYGEKRTSIWQHLQFVKKIVIVQIKVGKIFFRRWITLTPLNSSTLMRTQNFYFMKFYQNLKMAKIISYSNLLNQLNNVILIFPSFNSFSGRPQILWETLYIICCISISKKTYKYFNVAIVCHRWWSICQLYQEFRNCFLIYGKWSWWMIIYAIKAMVNWCIDHMMVKHGKKWKKNNHSF